MSKEYNWKVSNKTKTIYEGPCVIAAYEKFKNLKADGIKLDKVTVSRSGKLVPFPSFAVYSSVARKAAGEAPQKKGKKTKATKKSVASAPAVPVKASAPANVFVPKPEDGRRWICRPSSKGEAEATQEAVQAELGKKYIVNANLDLLGRICVTVEEKNQVFSHPRFHIEGGYEQNEFRQLINSIKKVIGEK